MHHMVKKQIHHCPESEADCQIKKIRNSHCKQFTADIFPAFPVQRHNIFHKTAVEIRTDKYRRQDSENKMISAPIHTAFSDHLNEIHAVQNGSVSSRLHKRPHADLWCSFLPLGRADQKQHPITQKDCRKQKPQTNIERLAPH